MLTTGIHLAPIVRLGRDGVRSGFPTPSVTDVTRAGTRLLATVDWAQHLVPASPVLPEMIPPDGSQPSMDGQPSSLSAAQVALNHDRQNGTEVRSPAQRSGSDEVGVRTSL